MKKIVILTLLVMGTQQVNGVDDFPGYVSHQVLTDKPSSSSDVVRNGCLEIDSSYLNNWAETEKKRLQAEQEEKSRQTIQECLDKLPIGTRVSFLGQLIVQTSQECAMALSGIRTPEIHGQRSVTSSTPISRSTTPINARN